MGRVPWKHFIKTSIEFQDEFGKDWRKTLEYGWLSPDMDHLFGQEVSESLYRKIVNKETGIDKFNISKDMIKTINYGK